jgi:hypothetical protein
MSWAKKLPERKTMEGWIKLHRKVLKNPIYTHDPTAWRVFNHLLLLVDKKTGSRDCGRFQLSRDLNIKPTTIYQSLKRLEKAKMVDIKTNNKYSTISISNWYSYQGNGDTTNDNKVTTNRQQNDTKQELRIKNKEYNTYSDEIKKLTDGLWKLVEKNNPHITKKSTISDYKAMASITKKIPVREVAATIIFSQTDDFWKTNILSVSGFKKHFDKLYVKAKNSGKVITI